MGLSLYLTYYFINIISFVIYTLDKRYSVYSKSRIPESILFLLAFLGGAFGAIFAMLLFRHKTRHKSFAIIVPILLIIQMLILIIFSIK